VPGDVRQDLVVHTERIREELGYREEVPFAEALRRTVAWERANPPAGARPVVYAEEDALLKGTGA
jgi:nucleoside-diphosphate-sugar epimerase